MSRTSAFRRSVSVIAGILPIVFACVTVTVPISRLAKVRADDEPATQDRQAAGQALADDSPADAPPGLAGGVLEIVPAVNWMDEAVGYDADAIFRQRLRFYGRCLQRWVSREAGLTPQQALRLAEQIKHQVDSLVPHRDRLASSRLQPFVPILFANRVAPEIDAVLQPASLSQLEFSQPQIQLLKVAMSLRQKQLREDNLAGILFLLENELFFTQSQSQLAAQLARRKLDLDDHGFTFLKTDRKPRGGRYFPEQNLKRLVKSRRIAETLSSHQLFLLRGLVAGERRFPVSREKLKQGEAGLLETQIEYCFHLQWAMSGASVDVLQQHLPMSEEQIQQIQMVTARLADKMLQRWYQLARQACLQSRNPFRIQESETFYASQPERTFIYLAEEPQLARRAVPGSWQVEAQRIAQLRMRLAAFMRGVLDRELWLSPDQRNVLFPVLCQTVRPEWTEPSIDDRPTYCWALECAAEGLLGPTEKELGQLAPEQVSAFVGLRRLFVKGPGWRRGYVVPSEDPEFHDDFKSRYYRDDE